MSEVHGDMASTTSRKTTTTSPSDISPSAYAMSTTVERSAECVLAVLSSNNMVPPYGRSISSPSGTSSSTSSSGGGGSSSPKKQHSPNQKHHSQHHNYYPLQSHQQNANGHGYGSGSVSHPSLMSTSSTPTLSASPTLSRKNFPGGTSNTSSTANSGVSGSSGNCNSPTMGTGTVTTSTSPSATTPTDHYNHQHQIFQDNHPNHEVIDHGHEQGLGYDKDTVDTQEEDDEIENENEDYCDEGQSISEDRSLTDSIPDSFHTPSASIQNLSVSSQKTSITINSNTSNNNTSSNINTNTNLCSGSQSQNNSARSSVRSTSSKSGSGSDSGHSNNGSDTNSAPVASPSGLVGLAGNSGGGSGSNGSSRHDSTEKLKIPKESSPKSKKDKDHHHYHHRDKDRDRDSIAPSVSSRGSPETPQQSKLSISNELTQPLSNLHSELSLSTESNVSKDSSGSSSGKETVYVSPHYAPKPNKKKMWYHVFYPSYKTRSGDFKKIFKDLPLEERLIVDYSCALQREILVQGRMYVSQNYISFYANIFGWETQTSIRFKDIASITKEKTALVIPNAVQVSTETERFFFTSFVTRDSTYVMLFKLWQSSLLEDVRNTLPTKEIWKLVHSCYGEELGVASEEDTEEFLACAPGYLVNAPSVSTLVSNSDVDDSKSIGEIDAQVCASELGAGLALPVGTVLATSGDSDGFLTVEPHPIPLISGPTSDISDTSDSEGEIDADHIHAHEHDLSGEVGLGVEIPLCPVPHAVGREVVSSVIPTDVDTLFTMLFTNSKFFLDLHTARKTFDIVQSEWQQSADGSQKVRQVSFTVTLNHVMGPKHSQVTESQVMLPVSKPGRMYAIDAESVNAGIPYADSFYVTTHYCLSRLSPNQTKLCIVNQIKFKKFVWKITKGFIEKNTWAGLEEFYTYLERALQEECGKINLSNQSPPNSPDITSTAIPIGRTKSSGRTRIKRIAPNPPGIPRTVTMPLPIAVLPNGKRGISTAKVPTARSLGLGGDSGVTVSAGSQTTAESSVVLKIILAILACLLLLNAFLYVKLTRFETAKSHLLFPSQPIAFPKNVPRNHQEWVALLQQQEDLHRLELQKWHEILISALKILHQAEEDLESLKFHITSYGNGKFTIDSLKDAIDVMQSGGSSVPLSGQKQQQPPPQQQQQQHVTGGGKSIGGEDLLEGRQTSSREKSEDDHQGAGTGSTNYPEETTSRSSSETEISSSTNQDANSSGQSESHGKSKQSLEQSNNKIINDEL